jgi:hypothetical protein
MNLYTAILFIHAIAVRDCYEIRNWGPLLEEPCELGNLAGAILFANRRYFVCSTSW